MCTTAIYKLYYCILFFSLSKHKANTAELHPKVRQTCYYYYYYYYYHYYPPAAGRTPWHTGPRPPDTAPASPPRSEPDIIIIINK